MSCLGGVHRFPDLPDRDPKPTDTHKCPDYTSNETPDGVEVVPPRIEGEQSHRRASRSEQLTDRLDTELGERDRAVLRAGEFLVWIEPEALVERRCDLAGRHWSGLWSVAEFV